MNGFHPTKNRHYLSLIAGELHAEWREHTVGSGTNSRTCWSYISEGLRKLGQQELVLTIKTDSTTAPPDQPFDLFCRIYSFAQQGQIVRSGDVTEFVEGGFLGSKALRGFAYTELLHDESFADSNALSMVGLMDNEVELVKRYGVTRLLARLGQVYSHYPSPPWNELTRPAMCVGESLDDSILRDVPGARVSGVTCVSDGHSIEVRLPLSAAGTIEFACRELPPDSCFSLLADLDRSADGCLAWRPGQAAPLAITAPQSRAERLSGCFLVFLPEQPHTGGRIVEDGYVLDLDSSWTEVRNALCTGAPLEVPSQSGQLGLRLVWIDDAEVGVPAASTMLFELLRSERDLPLDDEERAGFEHFTDAIEELVIAYFSALPPMEPSRLHLAIALPSGASCEVRIATDPALDSNCLARLTDRLLQLRRPTVRANRKLIGGAALWGAELPTRAWPTNLLEWLTR